ncbi:hypothetical protein F4820DRAFT_445417 [Hypoxylon rubiginosum]|uniref:Uncharacterized protein n=1 Tax=Hypoxylon rubiginosum TaxID=110542 RepID=A0ACB9Z996_9PEZI|nr:hypothetical protein F4820DRAFT_445417 [Hypoxylon rubiginosum]
MGNILGTPQTFYISYDWHDSSDSSYIDSDYVSSTSEESCAPYSWQQFVSDLLCCPWCGGTLDYKAEEEEDFGWDGAIVGVVRRRGCRIRDHWALAFRPGFDVSQLPRRIDGFRTRIPSRCRRTCRPQRVYVIGGESSSDDDDDSSVATEIIFVD